MADAANRHHSNPPPSSEGAAALNPAPMRERSGEDVAALAQPLAELEDVLTAAARIHEELLTLLDRKRHALRSTDTDAVAQLGELEADKLRRVAELETRRMQLVAGLTRHFAPDATEPMRLRELAHRLPEPHRGRLLVMRQQLVDRMQRVREAASVTRRATETLMHHIQGVVRTIGVLSTGVCTYGAAGAPTAGATAVRTINLTA
ncbi:MAG: flagellar protein FlgN [Phycisphaeraceae bacterium]